MGRCTKKIYSMETKTCGIPCTECEFYDKRNQNERKKDAWKEYAEQLKKDIEEYNPEDCDHCKYYDGGIGGWSSSCHAAKKSFDLVETRKGICPLKKYLEIQKNG